MNKIQNKLLQSLVLLLLFLFVMGDEEDEAIRIINSKATTWSAKKYSQEVNHRLKKDEFFAPVEIEDMPMLEHQGTYRRQVPRYFDARNNWLECREIIDYKRDQGSCASCWATSAASVMSDRICIGSKGGQQKQISAEDIVGCCYDPSTLKPCTLPTGKCSGGSSRMAFKMWKETGIVTGGNSGAGRRSLGCKPYKHNTFLGIAPICVRMCTNTPKYNQYGYEKDANFAKIVYRVPPQPAKMQREILNNGPISTFMSIYEDYRDYNCGIYQHVWGNHIADHFVKIVGWGEEREEPYWLIANSYGDRWGEHGMFRVLRGNNEAKIESICRTGSIKAPKQAREWIVDPPSSIRNLNNTSCLKCLFLFLLLLWMH